ncbi:MAG TPA: zinc-binding alcohol dehydrogenase family protein [Thermoplasmataceae archaeon]|nr:zinc-binding alcohol dehydrogenase family protein [Thermoplasmataceae archaeon]
MKAVGFYRNLPVDDPNSIVDVEIDKPAPRERNLLVRVKAVSVNPVDVKTRARKADDGKLAIPGWDVSGIVEETGPDCHLFKAGDEVYYAGSVSVQGADSEFHVVDERIAGKKPASLSHAEAAAMPLTSITAWEGMFDRMKIIRDPDLNIGKTILIIGGAGGVGSIATQLAHEAGLRVIATTSRPESTEWALAHGATYTIDRTKDFKNQINDIGLKYVDYIFCLNSLDEHWDSIAKVIAPLGHICAIIGPKGPIDMGALWDKSVVFSWEFMSTRPNYNTPDLIFQHEILNDLADLIDNGRIKTTLNSTMSPINASNMRKAHKQIESGTTIGKIVLEGF